MRKGFHPNMILTAILSLLVIFSACKKEHCFKSAGNWISEDRLLENFGKIVLYDNINLYITQDTVNRLSIQGGSHIIPYVLTEVKDGVLTIRDENSCNWLRSYKKKINVFLQCKTLFMIEYRGAGEVKSMNTIVSDSVELNFWDGSGCISLNLDCRMVRVHQHTGCGDAELSGRTTNASYYNRGNGQLRSRNLISDYTDIDAKCTNDSYIYAGNTLFARIGYIGNVYYAGHPTTLDTVITERGQLFRLD
jgi:hypothetical protein